MPAFYTHYQFAKDVYKNLDKQIASKIDYEYLLLFAQSFDILFYDFKLIRKKHSLTGLGHKAHQKDTQKFLINTIKNINMNNKEENSFLIGSIAHYILDSNFHPYIFYKTGTYKKNNAKYQKYNGLHTKLELLIDQHFYYTHHKTRFHKQKFHNIYNKILTRNNSNLKNVINKIYNQTYNIENVGSTYFKCLKKWKFVTKVIKEDQFGLKLHIYNLIDKVFKKHRYIKYYSFFYTDTITTYLNNEHNEWYNPANKKLKYNYSVDEIYNNSLNLCVKLIQIIYSKNKQSNFNKLLPNISYHSGLDLRNKPKIKYFEF